MIDDVEIINFYKNIKNIPFVGLGEKCQTRHNLSRLNLTQKSLPYDDAWSYSFDKVAESMFNDFEGFNDKENFEVRDEFIAFEGFHPGTGYNKKYNIHYAHHIMDEEFFNKLNRRISRFREILNSKNIVFVRQEVDTTPNKTIAQEIQNHYKKLNINIYFILIRNQPKLEIFSCEQNIIEYGFPVGQTYVGHYQVWDRALLNKITPKLI